MPSPIVTNAPGASRLADQLSDPASPAELAPNDQTAIEYRKLRIPREHGKILQIPPANALGELWNSNLREQQQTATGSIPSVDGSLNLAELRTAAREEIVNAAQEYSKLYLPEDSRGFRFRAEATPVIMSGHQPELFHPGVWFKNFVLSKLGQKFNAIAINLIVDSDLSTSVSVGYPQEIQRDGRREFQTATIKIDRASEPLPYEQRTIVDLEFLTRFPKRVELAMNSTDPRIAHRLWEHLLPVYSRLQAASDSNTQPALGATLAATRHRLEFESGLMTLEVPISRVCQTTSFFRFFHSIVFRSQHFRKIHNDVLREYRSVHGIRSRSHPVPELQQQDQWTETPFWYWDTNHRHRNTLWIRDTDQGYQLGRPQQPLATLGKSSFLEDLSLLVERGLAIRTRALTTTLFARLLASDLFLHGVGGAKYDQLTDAIAARFFNLNLPAYLTLSATMQLPLNYPLTRPEDIANIKIQRREYDYHPEHFVDRDDKRVRELIAEKRGWISGENRDLRSHEKHLAINEINERLRERIPITDQNLAHQQNKLKQRLRSSEIAGSREYSFSSVRTDVNRGTSVTLADQACQQPSQVTSKDEA